MSGTTSRLLAGALAAATARQAFVLAAVVRSRQFLAQPLPAVPGPARSPVFRVVLPVLREAALLPATVEHMRTLARQHDAAVIVITTAREDKEPGDSKAYGDTVAVARELAAQGRCVHLHYPDPDGVKADQLNYAAAWCQASLPDGISAADCFLVCYDADSRPPADSLDQFARAIGSADDADVFHQSSRFELRAPPRGTGPSGALGRTVCNAGALRANRFVLGFEVPRLLNRSQAAGRLKRALCSGVYAHVTGHGLCIRLSLLVRLPFPARSPLEDMHYSFILGSRGVPMLPVASLDCAEVPDTVLRQVRQAARWFFGPGRFTRYLRDPRTRRGPRAVVMAASAAGSAAEWIGCAIVPPLAAVALCARRAPAVRAAALALTVTCGIQVILTEMTLGDGAPLPSRVGRVAAFPVACMVHGAGGICGSMQLLTGGSGIGKTERGARE
jgi:hypothetical protein